MDHKWHVLLKNARWRHFKSSSSWLLYTGMGILVPVLIAYFVSEFMGGVEAWQQVASPEALSLYSASLIAAMLYSADQAEVPAGLIRVSMYVSLVVVSVIYMFRVIPNASVMAAGSRVEMLGAIALVVLGFVSLLAWVMKALEVARQEIESAPPRDPREMRQEQFRKLELSFSETGRTGEEGDLGNE